MAEELMTVKELSQYIHVNRMTVYKLARKGKMPAVKIGSEWRFKKKQIDDWLENRSEAGKEEEEVIKETAEREILVVDDDEAIRDFLTRILTREGYQVAVAPDGQKALDIARERELSLVFLDIKMPGMNGIDTLRVLKRIDKDIQVVMVTAYATVDTAVEAMRFGAFDYMRKPFDKDRLQEMVREGVKRRKLRIAEREQLKHLGTIKRDLDKRLEKLYSSTAESLMASINAKDAYTSSHSEEVAKYALLILEGLNLKLSPEEKRIFRYVCTLHDIGKIGISEKILRKKGRLNEREWKEIRKHPQIGASILQPIEFLKKFIPMVLHHHEHFDGKGYPEGKKGAEIPLWARILAVADTYHAMRSDRSYRPAMSKEEALKELKAGAGTQFDPEIVKVALRVLKEQRRVTNGS